MDLLLLIFKYFVSTLFLCNVGLFKDCTEIIHSDSKNKNGTLQSIGYDSYPNNIRCYYYFVGLIDERVEIDFTVFDVNGVPPRCVHDFIDIYTQLDSVNVSLLEVPSQGRYCGKDKENLPYLIISVKNIILVDFHTDNSGDGKGFELKYRFFPDAIYKVGTKAQQHLCGFLINKLKQGTILSPTYPGVYPDNITCFYKFEGEIGERIKLTFNDIDLYYGGSYCPFDYIKVYDGPTNEAHVIDTLCGTHKAPFVLYSTGNYLQVYFVSRSGRKILTAGEGDETPSQLKGFNASFEIGSRFVDLSRISEGQHLEGTECDRIIESKSKSQGTITSPYYPESYPIGIVCHYDINGLVDKQNLEKVQLFIEDVDIGDEYVYEDVPVSGKVGGGSSGGGGGGGSGGGNGGGGSGGGGRGGDAGVADDGDDGEKTDLKRLKCLNGVLEVYSSKATQSKLTTFKQEQREQSTAKLNPPIPDYQFCGSSPNGKWKFQAKNITSDSPKMLLIFDTVNSKPGKGFKARYEFSTDYAIPGTPVGNDNKCHFIYNSTAAIQGTFNSPRHPSFYPVDTYCTYEFFGQPDEIVRLTFENFQVENDTNCTKDYVQISKFQPHKKTYDVVGHYCGYILPGPQDEDSPRMKVFLYSDGHNVFKGFRARYEFVKRQPLDKKCFYNTSSEGGGTIYSPNFPHKYTTNKTCEWIVTGRTKASKILLNFDIFAIEGNPNDKIGCGNAVLKIYKSRNSTPAYELCGDDKSISGMEMKTEINVLRLKFVSTAKATGGKGFKLLWTEILPMKGGKCPGFLCEKSGYCIPNAMKCNGVANCGKDDQSDELKNCGSPYRETGTINVVLCVLGVCSLVLVLCGLLWLYCKRRKRKDQRYLEVRYMTKTASGGGGGTGLENRNGSSALKERTEKITII